MIRKIKTAKRSGKNGPEWKIYLNKWIKFKTSVFAMDGMDFGDIFSCPEFVVARLDAINGFLERTANLLSWQTKTEWPHNFLVQWRELTSLFSRLSRFKYCVAIGMCLIVALCFPFLLKYVSYFIVQFTLSGNYTTGDEGQLKIYFYN